MALIHPREDHHAGQRSTSAIDARVSAEKARSSPSDDDGDTALKSRQPNCTLTLGSRETIKAQVRLRA